MPAMDTEALLRRADQAKQKRDSFASLMRDCYAFAMPERDAWASYGHGQDRQTLVYDSTAVVAVPRFANRLQQALFPPAQRWAKLDLAPEYADDDEAQPILRDLEAATDLMFRHIHASNFDAAIAEWGHDLSAGVGCLLIENGRFGQRRTRGPLLRFQAVPSALVAFDEGPWGTVEGVFFTQRMKARMVMRHYPDAKDLPPALRATMADKPDAEAELLQATTYDAEADLWRFEVVVVGERTRIVSREYRTCPWVVTRWSKAPGETHGRGPLTQALPDIRTVNKLMEFHLRSAAFAVAGAWTVLDDGITNPDVIRIAPGVVIPVASNGGTRGPSLKGLEFPGNFQLSEVLMDRMQTRIRQMLFDDPLPPDVTAGLTATEVIERVRRFQADTGAFGRLQADAVVPIVMRVIDIMEEAGEFARGGFRDLMQALRDDVARIVATSPLSQAQDRADVQATFSFITGAVQMGDAGAALLETGVNLDRAGPFLAARSGVPLHLVPTAQEVDQRRQARAQAQQQEQLLTSPVATQVAGALAGAAAREGAPNG